MTVKDSRGVEVYSGPTVFLPAMTTTPRPARSRCPARCLRNSGFFGNLLPTGVITAQEGPISIFPDAKDPALALGLYEGELNPGGLSGSVYTLNTTEMTQVNDTNGETEHLDQAW